MQARKEFVELLTFPDNTQEKTVEMELTHMF
jgi:hypothetical protein